MKSCTCTSPQPTYISYGIDVNFEPHTTIVCSTCDGASLGIFDRIQAVWYDDTDPEIEPSKPIICGTGGEFSEWIDGEAYFHQMWDIEASNIYQNPDEIGQGLREDAIPTYNPNDGFSLEMLEDCLKVLNKRSHKTNYQDDISSVAVEPHKKQYPIKKWFDKFRK